MACLRLGVRRGWLRRAKPGVEAEAAAVPSGGGGRGEDRREDREASRFRGGGRLSWGDGRTWV